MPLRTRSRRVEGAGNFDLDVLPRANTTQESKERTKALFYIRQAEQHALTLSQPGERAALIVEPWFIPYRGRTEHRDEINELFRLIYLMWEQVPLYAKYQGYWKQVFNLVVESTKLILNDNGGLGKKKVSVNLKKSTDNALAETMPNGDIIYHRGAFTRGPADLVDTILHECAHSLMGIGLKAPHNRAWHDRAVQLGMVPGYSTRGGALDHVPCTTCLRDEKGDRSPPPASTARSAPRSRSMAIKIHSWEEFSEPGRSRPAAGVSVKEWRTNLGKLSAKQQKHRAHVNDPHVYSPMRMGFTPEHIQTLARGGSIKVGLKHILGHETTGQIVHWPLSEFEKILKVLQTRRAQKLSLADHALHFNVKHGGGIWDDIKDFGRKAIDVATTVILPVVGAVLDALPPGPHVVAARVALKVVSGLATQLNNVVNKKEEAQVAVQERQADYQEAKLAAREPGLTAAQKTKLTNAANAAKSRIAAAKLKAAQLAKEEKSKKSALAAAERKAASAEARAVKSAQQQKK